MDSNCIHQYEPLWGEWHVKGLIGEGSFGRVYIIEKMEDGHAYRSAAKLITIPTQQQKMEAQRSFGSDAVARTHYFGEIVDNVVTEINLLNRLAGSGYIVEYKDHKIIRNGEGTDIIIRMELLTDIRAHYAKHPASVRDVLRMARDVCMGLGVCAKYGVVHRDIKLDNIFMSEHGLYKIGDFGVSRFMGSSGASTVVGTYDYMAPEVVREGRYDGRVDIYSLGLVLYRLLNNDRMPFMPAYPAETKMRDRDEAYRLRMTNAAFTPPANAPAALWAVIQKACAYEPSARFASAEEMRTALEDAEREISREELNRAVYPPAPMGEAARPVSVPASEGTGTMPDFNPKADTGTGTMPIFTTTPLYEERRNQTISMTEAARNAQPAAAQNTGGTRRCLKCGTALRGGEVFCTQCGALNPAATYGGEAADKKVKKKRGPIPKAWVAALVISLIVVLGGAFICFGFGFGLFRYYYHIVELFVGAAITVVSGCIAIIGFMFIKKGKLSRILLLVGGNLLAVLGIIVQLYNGYFMWYFALPMMLLGVVLTMLYTRLQIGEKKQDADEKAKRAGKVKVCLQAVVAILAAALVACALAVFAPTGEGESITFEDKNLEHVIRETINKRLGTITTGDMERVDEIFGPNRRIYNIEPIKYCSSVDRIELFGNEISDISALSGLTSITVLSLQYNYVSDISALSGLKNLINLYLDNNSISNIGTLSGLTNLERLDLSNNLISDVGALSGLTNLERLDLSNNLISDVGTLSGLTNLTALNLSGNPVSDISALSGLNNTVVTLTALMDTGDAVIYEVIPTPSPEPMPSPTPEPTPSPTPTPAPSAPQFTEITPDGPGYDVTLKWGAVADATSYNLYRNGDFVTNLAATEYTDKNLDAYTHYSYTVTAVNEYGEGLASNAANTTTAPAAPHLRITVFSEHGDSQLSWNAVEGARYYKIYWKSLCLGGTYSDTTTSSSYCLYTYGEWVEIYVRAFGYESDGSLYSSKSNKVSNY